MMTVRHQMPRCSRLAASFLLLLQMLPISASPLSSCYGNSTTLDWYIDAVGETPCMTYQKLRQICNSNYQTPSWAIGAYTDQCNDPLSTCCCNSIAWSVRMLCINCQWDKFGTTDPGHSANPGAYYNYRWSSGTPNQGSYCGDGWNQTLPESIQLAVCQNGVRLEDFLYDIFWTDGSWNFTDFEQRAQHMLASRTQPLSPCQNATQSATSTSAPTTSSGGSSQAPVGGKVNIAAAVGGSLGGALGLVVLGAIIAIFRYRRRLRRLRGTTEVPMIDSQDLSHNKVGSMPEYLVTPFFGQYRESEHLPKGTPSPRAYGEEILHQPGSYTVPTLPGYGEEEDGPPTPSGPSALDRAEAGLTASRV